MKNDKKQEALRSHLNHAVETLADCERMAAQMDAAGAPDLAAFWREQAASLRGFIQTLNDRIEQEKGEA